MGKTHRVPLSSYLQTISSLTKLGCPWPYWRYTETFHDFVDKTQKTVHLSKRDSRIPPEYSEFLCALPSYNPTAHIFTKLTDGITDPMRGFLFETCQRTKDTFHLPTKNIVCQWKNTFSNSCLDNKAQVYARTNTRTLHGSTSPESKSDETHVGRLHSGSKQTEHAVCGAVRCGTNRDSWSGYRSVTQWPFPVSSK